ncbi:MAG: J domain-containing protein [Spirochaetia bacterium]|nr:J domain-containing protein [Spirochaetia bacterium]
MSRGVFIDHYAALDLKPGAPPEEVRRAFRKLAKTHHPDKNGGDALKFHELYTAYKLLTEPISRVSYDKQYILFKRAELWNARRKSIPVSRMVIPTTVAALARRGLLRPKFRGKDRRFHLKVDYDMELPLLPEEFQMPLLVPVPVTIRNLCPECLGSDSHCGVCGGKGSYKSGGVFKLHLDGGLTHGQVLEISLHGMRPAPASYYKKRKIRIKITKAS